MKKIKLYLIAVCVLVIVSGCLIGSSNKKEEKVIYEGSFWADNVVDYKSIDENEDSVFYNSKDGIVRYDKNTKINSIIIRSKSTTTYCLSGQYIYFYINGKIIYRSDLNGNNCEKFIESNQVRSFFLNNSAKIEVYNDFLYIIASQYLIVRFDLVTKQAEVFSEDVSNYAFIDNSFYYIDYGKRSYSIYRKDLSSGQVDLIRGDGLSTRSFPQTESDTQGRYYEVISINNRLYYTMRMSKKIFSLNADGEDTLVEDYNNNEDYEYLIITKSGNKLYYLLQAESNKLTLFEYNTENGEKKAIQNLNYYYNWYNFKVVNNCVFYKTDVGNSVYYFTIEWEDG